ncbi:C4-dicarboxylate ABC transporter permease [Clostridium sp. AM58-1XD]|nr:C4-dicarboxylate ABC transporter permease [Clostridium sp. AM58-1XD]
MLQEVLGNLFTIQNFIYLNIGLAGGIIIGALPGLTATMGVALLIPLTYGMNSITGLLLLLGVYCGGTYGGSITAILIKTPGTPASAATVLDGYKMAQQGRGGEALQMALTASTIGGIFSALVLLFVAPVIAKFALKFGPSEYFALALFGLTIISSVSGESVIKGLMMGFTGLLITVIGIDPIEGIERFTFGNVNLAGGIDLIPAMIGLFAISEILMKSGMLSNSKEEILKFEKRNLSWKTLKENMRTIMKSCVIGTFIGAVPGTGAAIASFLSYNEAKRSSKTPEKFGTGYIEGVAASEAGNNAVTGATLIPLLTLGIPGDAITAVLIGALMMQGIVPGPQLFTQQKEWVYCIMIGLILVNIFMFIQGHVFSRFFVNVTKVPQKILVPLLVVFCVIGAYATNNTTFDALIMLLFGIAGYYLNKLDFPLTPMVIAIVLGSMAETNFRRALLLSNGDPWIFFQKPISTCFILLAAVMIVMPSIKKARKNRVPKKEN